MVEELLKKIEELIKNNSNSSALARSVGVRRQVIDKYKKGQSEYINMTAENLIKFEKYMEENKVNIDKIANKGYIWEFEQLGDFLDEDNNFMDREDFDWWKELADSLAYLEENEVDILALEINELQDYIDIAEDKAAVDKTITED